MGEPSRSSALYEIVIGPMYAGKSQFLLEQLEAAEARSERVVAATHTLDTRWPGEIVSHAGSRHAAYAVPDARHLLKLVVDHELVVIDEAQFFDAELVAVLRKLRCGGTRVVAAALDLDFRGEPFGVVPALVEDADVVHRLTAICGACGGRAALTQRILNGAPAPLDDEVVRVGGTELYAPRCSSCYAWERRAVQARTA
jgi:thymidine kinase